MTGQSGAVVERQGIRFDDNKRGDAMENHKGL